MNRSRWPLNMSRPAARWRERVTSEKASVSPKCSCMTQIYIDSSATCQLEGSLFKEKPLWPFVQTNRCKCEQAAVILYVRTIRRLRQGSIQITYAICKIRLLEGLVTKGTTASSNITKVLRWLISHHTLRAHWQRLGRGDGNSVRN
jgi:hypothetical protein